MTKMRVSMSEGKLVIRAAMSNGEDREYLGYKNKGFQIEVTAQDFDLTELMSMLNKVYEVVDNMAKVQAVTDEVNFVDEEVEQVEF